MYISISITMLKFVFVSLLVSQSKSNLQGIDLCMSSDSSIDYVILISKGYRRSPDSKIYNFWPNFLSET